MAYTLHLQTQYHNAVQYHSASQNGAVQKGQQASFNGLGNLWFTIPGVGNVNLLDIGQRKIAGFSKATWGVLIGFQGEECEFRYEGGGQLTINVTDLGQVELSSNGSIIRVSLPPFIFKH
ncbi:MAG: hypothetical protein M3444_20190 [Acidobacteriota bacterium]|nr:hypothetical protein [Acidobacteriota bacterium]MDQ5835918.1 hypothetical protein [Acidobacteriota bacterium]